MPSIRHIAKANFYPRSPCGERRYWFGIPLVGRAFLSTLSLRRATARRASRQQPAGISIHALLAESDLAGPSGPAFLYNFYPRSPCGERLRLCWFSLITLPISIHALLAESDIIRQHSEPDDGNFYPRSPCGERLVEKTIAFYPPVISIHALLAESD